MEVTHHRDGLVHTLALCLGGDLRAWPAAAPRPSSQACRGCDANADAESVGPRRGAVGPHVSVPPRSRFGPRRRPGRAGHERASHGGRRGGLLNLRRPMRPSCFTTGLPAWFVALDVMTGHKRMVKLAKSNRPYSHGGTAPMTSPRRTSAATRPIAFRQALPCVRSAPRRPLRAPLYR